MYKSIDLNNVIPVSFRLRQCERFTVPRATSTVWRLGDSSAPEKPRWILIGLQTDKSGGQVRNAALFDHCNLTNMQVVLNHSRYPSVDMPTDFVKEQFAGIYKSFYDFASRYYGIDNLLVNLEMYYSFEKATIRSSGVLTRERLGHVSTYLLDATN